MSWLVLPATRDFDVSFASVSLTLPDTAVLLQDPWVEEPGWEVARQAHGMTAQHSRVARSESATVGVEFTIDRMAAAIPQWQSDRDLAAEFVPAFISGGVFILVIAAGALWMLRFKYPPFSATGEGVADAADADGERDGIAPAMRMAVMRGRCRGDRAEIASALQGLMARGVVALDGDRWRLVGTTQDLRAHERLVADALARRPAGGRVAVGGVVPRRARGRFRRALIADLVAVGLADPDRAAAARDLHRAGLVVVLFGLVMWATVAAAWRQFGAWPLAVPCSIVIAGAMFLSGAARFRILSEAGARARMLYFARVLDGRTSV